MVNRAENLRCQIIEIADDIAYAVHDLEDGLALRKFNVDEILFALKLEEKKQNIQDVNKPSVQCEKIVKEAKKYADKSEGANIQEYSKIFRLKLTSLLTDKLSEI